MNPLQVLLMPAFFFSHIVSILSDFELGLMFVNDARDVWLYLYQRLAHNSTFSFTFLLLAMSCGCVFILAQDVTDNLYVLVDEKLY